MTDDHEELLGELRQFENVFERDNPSMKASQLARVFQMLGLTNAVAKDTSKLIDMVALRAGTASVDIEEFVTLIAQKRSNQSPEDEIESAFRILSGRHDPIYNEGDPANTEVDKDALGEFLVDDGPAIAGTIGAFLKKAAPKLNRKTFIELFCPIDEPEDALDVFD